MSHKYDAQGLYEYFQVYGKLPPSDQYTPTTLKAMMLMVTLNKQSNTPTQEQIDQMWTKVSKAIDQPQETQASIGQIWHWLSFGLVTACLGLGIWYVSANDQTISPPAQITQNQASETIEFPEDLALFDEDFQQLDSLLEEIAYLESGWEEF